MSRATMPAVGSSTTPAGPEAVPSGYRPHLDGVRALAVYLVVLYHAGLGGVGDGFIGVDIFFVLSGYLVTQLLVRDIQGHGSIRLRRFYARRYRRLLPAAFVTLMVTAVLLVVLGTASEVLNAEDGFRASFLYVANWYFIRQAADYFAADVNSNPVVHFWSLAVEEQFYLLWPLLFGGLHLLARRSGRSVRWIRWPVVIAAGASALAALHIASTDLSRAYYGTDTRAYQLLAGAFLALTPSIGAWAARTGVVRAVAALMVGAAIVLATTLEWIDPIQRGIAITIVTMALLVSLEASSPEGLAVRGLSHPAVAYLGRISYGTYLWHWPFIVLLGTQVTLDPVPLAIWTCVVATALAAVSHHVVEKPVRASRALDRRPTAVIAAGIGVSVVSGLVLIPAVFDRKESAPLDWKAAQLDNPPLPLCTAEDRSGCTLVHGSGPHVLLLGDSNARMYIPAFTEIAKREDLTLSVAVQPRCPWPRGIYYLLGVEKCQKAQAFWYGDLTRALDPDIVVLSQRPMDDPASPVDVYAPEGELDYGSKGYDEAIERAMRQSAADLRAGGRKLVFIEPIPIATIEDDPLSCLSSATDVDKCAYRANDDPTPIELVYRSEADEKVTWSLDLDELVCPRLPKCDAVVDDLIVKRDNDHVTGTYSAHLADDIDAMLRAQGVLG